MADYVLPSEINQTGGLDVLTQFIVLNVPYITSMILIGVALLLILGGYLYQRRTTATGRFSEWFAVGTFITAVLAILASVAPTQIPLITIPETIIFISVAIIGFMFFIFSKLD